MCVYLVIPFSPALEWKTEEDLSCNSFLQFFLHATIYSIFSDVVQFAYTFQAVITKQHDHH